MIGTQHPGKMTTASVFGADFAPSNLNLSEERVITKVITCSFCRFASKIQEYSDSSFKSKYNRLIRFS